MPFGCADFAKKYTKGDMKSIVQNVCSEGTCAAAEEGLKALAVGSTTRIVSTFLATTLAFVNKQIMHAKSNPDSTTYAISAAGTAVASVNAALDVVNTGEFDLLSLSTGVGAVAYAMSFVTQMAAKSKGCSAVGLLFC